MTDDLTWEEKYHKLKKNFDRLDRLNDVLYRYYFYATRNGLEEKVTENARIAVEEYLQRLDDERNKLDS